MNKVITAVTNAQTIAIGGHIRPDGDCVGSCMGLYLYLRKEFPGKEIDLYLEPIAESFKFIKDTDKILHDCSKEKTYDLFLALDSGDTGRLGDAVKYFQTAKMTVCVDHHISNVGYAMENLIFPEVSSTAEVIYGLLEDEKITKEIAEALYMGIVHDTGVFQYSDTSSKTMQIAGKLMDKGIEFTKIIDNTYFQKTYLQNQILGRALLESIRVMEGTCIISVLRKKDIEFYGVSPVDLDGIVAQLRNTAGVEVALFIYETELQEFKVSMRSKNMVDVQKIASYFGGGGHVRAAGCSMQGSEHDVINNLTKQIELQMNAVEEA